MRRRGLDRPARPRAAHPARPSRSACEAAALTAPPDREPPPQAAAHPPRRPGWPRRSWPCSPAAPTCRIPRATARLHRQVVGRRVRGLRAAAGLHAAPLGVRRAQPDHRRARGDDRGGRGDGAVGLADHRRLRRAGRARRRRRARAGDVAVLRRARTRCSPPARSSCGTRATCSTSCSAPARGDAAAIPTAPRRPSRSSRACAGSCARSSAATARPRSSARDADGVRRASSHDLTELELRGLVRRDFGGRYVRARWIGADERRTRPTLPRHAPRRPRRPVDRRLGLGRRRRASRPTSRRSPAAASTA